jgi:hypothetical protein
MGDINARKNNSGDAEKKWELSLISPDFHFFYICLFFQYPGSLF